MIDARPRTKYQSRTKLYGSESAATGSTIFPPSDVQQQQAWLSTSIPSPPSTFPVARITSQSWWWWWYAWNDRSNTRYVAVYVCAARAPIIFATRSERHCSSLPVRGPLPLSRGQRIIARPRPPPSPWPAVDRGLARGGCWFVDAAEWAEFIARLTPSRAVKGGVRAPAREAFQGGSKGKRERFEARRSRGRGRDGKVGGVLDGSRLLGGRARTYRTSCTYRPALSTT